MRRPRAGRSSKKLRLGDVRQRTVVAPRRPVALALLLQVRGRGRPGRGRVGARRFTAGEQRPVVHRLRAVPPRDGRRRDLHGVGRRHRAQRPRRRPRDAGFCGQARGQGAAGRDAPGRATEPRAAEARVRRHRDAGGPPGPGLAAVLVLSTVGRNRRHGPLPHFFGRVAQLRGGRDAGTGPWW